LSKRKKSKQVKGEKGEEDRRQEIEDRGQKTEDRGQRTEDRGQKSGDRL
jgi:hypothetical protein